MRARKGFSAVHVVKYGSENLIGCDKGQNRVNSRKHRPFWLLPVYVLIQQFRYAYNIFFLINACLQLVPSLRVGSVAAAFTPMVTVYAVNLLKEIVDDTRRFIADRRINMKLVSLADGSHIHAQDLCVGSLLSLSPGHVPCDVVLTEGTIEVSTAALDGESTVHYKKAVELVEDDELKLQIDPNTFKVCGEVLRGETAVTGVATKNVVFADSLVVGGSATALVFAVGDGCATYASAPSSTAINDFDVRLNSLIKLSFFIVFVGAAIFASCKPGPWLWPTAFMRYVVLFSNIIPNSLAVTITVLRACLTIVVYFVSGHGAVGQTTDANEQLGAPDVAVFDKTGTLTRNVMKCKLIDSRGALDALDIYASCLVNHSCTYSEPKSVVSNRKEPKPSKLTSFISNYIYYAKWADPIFTSFDNYRGLVGSPDEVALIETAEADGYSAIRDGSKVTIQHANACCADEQSGVELEVLHSLPFDPALRTSTIIVRHNGGIYVLTKGADDAITTSAANVTEDVARLARDGYRVLVHAALRLTDDEYDQIEAGIRSLNSAETRAKLESGCYTLLGFTCVVDDLAEGAASAINYLQTGGCKCVIATGDRPETAAHVAAAVGLAGSHAHPRLDGFFESGYPIYLSGTEVTRVLGEFEVTRLSRLMEVMELPTTPARRGLSAEGVQLVKNIQAAPSTVVYRATPTDKLNLVRALRFGAGQLVMATGDGANDVLMLTSASVGVGIHGREGASASRAADLALHSVNQLKSAVAVHGRGSLMGVGHVATVILQRGLALSVAQAAFSVTVGPENAFDPWLLAVFAFVCTGLPAFYVGFSFEPEGPGATLTNLRANKPISWLDGICIVIGGLAQGLVAYFGAYLLNTGTTASSASFASVSYIVILSSVIYAPCKWPMLVVAVFTVLLTLVCMALAPGGSREALRSARFWISVVSSTSVGVMWSVGWRMVHVMRVTWAKQRISVLKQ